VLSPLFDSTGVLSFLSFVRFAKSVAWRDILAFCMKLGVIVGADFQASRIQGTSVDSYENRKYLIGLYLQLLPESTHEWTFAPQTQMGKHAKWWHLPNVQSASTGNGGIASGPALDATLPDSPTVSPTDEIDVFIAIDCIGSRIRWFEFNFQLSTIRRTKQVADSDYVDNS
jgi:hypothetical protein